MYMPSEILPRGVGGGEFGVWKKEGERKLTKYCVRLRGVLHPTLAMLAGLKSL